MRASLLILALVALLSLLSACGGKPPEDSQPPPAGATASKNPEQLAYEMVVNNFERNDFAGAIRAAQDYVKRYPDTEHLPQVLYLSGRASISRGDFDTGETTLEEMLRRFPQNENVPFADFYRAQAIYLKTDVPVKEYKLELPQALPGYERALTAFQEVAEKYKGDAEVATRARLMAAQVLFDMGRREEALKAFRAYVAQQPDGEYTDQALFQIGALLVDLERYGEAKKAYNELNRKFPGNPNSGTAIDRLREMSLIGHPMPPLGRLRWMSEEKAPATKGKVVMVVFFNTWCPHCQHEMPRLEKIYSRLKDKGLVLLALTSHSRGQTDGSVVNFISKYGLTFPVAVESGQTADAYAVGRIPAVAIVDRKGIVRWRNSGDLVTESLIERYL